MSSESESDSVVETHSGSESDSDTHTDAESPNTIELHPETTTNSNSKLELPSESKMKLTSFEQFKFSHWLVKQCSAVGMNKPTEIQINCIPAILKGQDCIGCAKTGSGKTAAFALPILQKLSEDPYGIFALVLTPTRELAFQIGDQFKALGKPIQLRVTVITGGRDYIQQGQDLTEKPHILISTPGRLADLLENTDTFNLNKIKFLVLDEADRLLTDFGDFAEQMEPIFKRIPTQRQTLLFSATMSDTFKELQRSAMTEPFFYETVSQVATVEQLEQLYMLCPYEVKDAYLVQILREFLKENKNSLIMVFSHTCKYVQILGMILKELGFSNCVLHSMTRQQLRLEAMSLFKSHQVRILVATDLASRGLDIPTCDLVINHSVPTRPQDYIHRVGRTARAGRVGRAITLVSQFDVKLIQAVEERINTKLTEYKIDEKEVSKILLQVAVARREAEIRLDDKNFGEQKQTRKRIRQILAGQDPDVEEKLREKKIRLKRKEAMAKAKERDARRKAEAEAELSSQDTAEAS